MNLLRKDITFSLYLFITSFIVFCTQSYANSIDYTINKDSLIVENLTPKTTIYITNKTTLIINKTSTSSDIKLVYLKKDSIHITSDSIQSDSLVGTHNSAKTNIYIVKGTPVKIDKSINQNNNVKIVYITSETSPKSSEKNIHKPEKALRKTPIFIAKQIQKLTSTSTNEKKDFRKLPYNNRFSISQLNFVKGISTTNTNLLKKIIYSNQVIPFSFLFKDEVIKNERNKTIHLTLTKNTLYCLNYAMRPPPMT
jgi:hypothetical protein